MLLTNRLFFEQVEAMLAEGHEVQIRMKGHSMRPLLRRTDPDCEICPGTCPGSRGIGGSRPRNPRRRRQCQHRPPDPTFG